MRILWALSGAALHTGAMAACPPDGTTRAQLLDAAACRKSDQAARLMLI
ncbi:MAG TPA: hypothetical protein VGC21_24165 [Telluria sp.]|jgi:hypothetical protein